MIAEGAEIEFHRRARPVEKTSRFPPPVQRNAELKRQKKKIAAKGRHEIILPVKNARGAAMIAALEKHKFRKAASLIAQQLPLVRSIAAMKSEPSFRVRRKHTWRRPKTKSL
jgi:hypothetical protein